MKIIYVRHGESEANAKLMLADPAPGLTEKGREQARVTAEELNKFSFTTVLSSPFLRARQTAEIITAGIGFDTAAIQFVDDLHERRLGVLENTPREHPSEWYYRVENVDGIEPGEMVLKRSIQAFELAKQLSEQGTVLIIGHACAGFYIWQVAKGNTSLASFEPSVPLDNAGYRILQD